MKPSRLVLASLAASACLAGIVPAHAFCVYNELKDRSVSLVQEDHPDWKRQESRFQKTLKPGASACCEFKNLDCNPNGRQNSLVGLDVAVEGEAALKCGPVGVPAKARVVKVMGAGTVRVVPNPRYDAKKEGTSPYIVRVWSHDNQDITGPAGLPCR